MINSFGNRDYYSSMRNRLPWYDLENSTQQELLKALSEELVRLENVFNTIARNFDMTTAVELIYYLEKKLEVKVDPESSIEKRREKIINRLLFIFEKTTKEAILKALSGLTDSMDVDMRTTSIPGIYEIVLAVYGEIKNYSEILYYLEKTIPAHLMFRITVVFKTHIEVRQAAASVIGNIEYSNDEVESETTNMSFINLRANVYGEAKSYIGSDNYAGEENMEDEYR